MSRMRSDPSESVFSPSCVACWQKCPRLWYYRYILPAKLKEGGVSLVPIQYEVPALSFGSVWHSALAKLYTGHSIEECLAEFDKLPKDMEVAGRRSAGAGKVRFKEYVEHYSIVDGRGESQFSVLDTELEIDITLSDGTTLIGVFDAIIEYNGNHYVFEHKTASSISSNYFRGFRPNLQLDAYAYACRKIIGECYGILLNVISTAQNPKIKFARDISPRTSRELDAFEENFISTVMDILSNMNSPPMHTSACGTYGACAYRELCVRGDSALNMFKVITEDELTQESEEN